VRNWILALSTIVGAAIVEGYAFMRVMGTAGCTTRICPEGPGEGGFTIITYGAPLVAVAAVPVSFVTARRPYGWVVPAVAWTLLVVAFVVLTVTFRG